MFYPLDTHFVKVLIWLKGNKYCIILPEGESALVSVNYSGNVPLRKVKNISYVGLTEKINYAISLNTGIINMSLSVSLLHNIMHILGTVYAYTHSV